MEGATGTRTDPPSPRVVIVGAGGMGRLLGGLLAPDARALTLVDPCFEGAPDGVELAIAGVVRVLHAMDLAWRVEGDATARTLRLEGRTVPLVCVPPSAAEQPLAAADVVVLALPYTGEEQFGALASPYARGLRAGALVTDTASLKVGPLRALDAVVPRGCDLFGTHPIFGPGVSDVAGQVIATVLPPEGRAPSPWRSWLIDTFVRRRLLVTPCTAEAHDRAMAHVQVLTHFVLLALARCFVRGNVEPADLLPFRSPVFEPLVYLAARVAVLAWDSPETYAAIQRQEGSDAIRRAFLDAAEEIRAHVEGTAGSGEPDGSLEALFVRTGAYWGHVPTTLKADPRARIGGDVRSRLERRSGEPFRRANILAVSNSAMAELVRARRDVLDSAGRIRALRDTSTGATHVGLLYVDPERHDKVDLSSRVRFRRVNLPTGVIYDPGKAWPRAATTPERLAQIEAGLASIPLLQAQFLDDDDLFSWLDGALDHEQPGRGLNRYAIRSTPALALRVPHWFDEEIVNRLLRGCADVPAGCRLWRVRFGWIEEPREGPRAAQLFLHCFLHPETMIEIRADEVLRLAGRGTELGAEGDPRAWAFSSIPITREQHVEADRRVRRAARRRIDSLVDGVRAWLLEHGCEPR